MVALALLLSAPNLESSSQAVVDVQLMECRLRKYDRHYRRGLARAIPADAGLGQVELAKWTAAKSAGKAAFLADENVWSKRPMAKSGKVYAANDPLYLLKLYTNYDARLTTEDKAEVAHETIKGIGRTWELDWSLASYNIRFSPWPSCWVRPRTPCLAQYLV